MSTLLALLFFTAATVVVGIALAWLSDSSRSLSFSSLSLSLSALFRLPVSDNARSSRELRADAELTSQNSEPPVQQLIEQVNAKLPQTQCAQCGHPGCRPYANAIILEDAPINQCPPGGEALIHELADFLGKPFIALDAERGESKPPLVALIDEPACIGCTLCIAACPVDAIVGASRLMHTVISHQCTGCELCLPPCPVDCIELVPANTELARWHWPKPL